MHNHINTYIDTYLPTYLPTYLHTYTYTYTHTFTFTYTHTYAYTYTRMHTKISCAKAPSSSGPLSTLLASKTALGSHSNTVYTQIFQNPLMKGCSLKHVGVLSMI